MPLQNLRCAFVGAGSMGEALIRGLLNQGTLLPVQITVTAPREQRRTYLSETYGVSVSDDNCAACVLADLIVLAVKPQILASVLAQLATLPANKLVVSIVAGKSISYIENALPTGVRVCRAMPNTPAIVGAGATAIAAGPKASEDDLKKVRALFASVGLVTAVEESLLDAATGLSGSGPAYVFMIIEALSDAGVKVGLPRRQALELAAQTVLGSAQLLISSGEHPGVLKDRVTSPGGTAIAGLHTLEEGGLRKTLINAVVAASARSKELGEL